MVLITSPHVSPLYFTKPGVLWEYATVAGESAQAFVYFTEAGRRAWRTAQHAGHWLWRNIYLFCPGGGSIPGGGAVPPRVVCFDISVVFVCVRVSIFKLEKRLHFVHRLTTFSLRTNTKNMIIFVVRVSLRGIIRKCITSRENGLLYLMHVVSFESYILLLLWMYLIQVIIFSHCPFSYKIQVLKFAKYLMLV